MIRHKQTIFGYGTGNCFQTAIASVLDLPLESVPNFCASDTWFEDMISWCHSTGVGVMYTATEKIPVGIVNCYAIATGLSPRWRQMAEQHPDVDKAKFLHCVVARIKGWGEAPEWAHDPHPDDTFVEDIRDWVVLIPGQR